MITITLDNCSLDPKSKELQELKRLKNEGRIKLYVEGITLTEREAYDKDISWLFSTAVIPNYVYVIPDGKNLEDVERWSKEDYEKMYKIVRSIAFPHIKRAKHQSLNEDVDIQIAVLHVLQKRDFFITNNTTHFIKQGRQAKFERIGIKVRQLDQSFIEELKSLL